MNYDKQNNNCDIDNIKQCDFEHDDFEHRDFEHRDFEQIYGEIYDRNWLSKEYEGDEFNHAWQVFKFIQKTEGPAVKLKVGPVRVPEAALLYFENTPLKLTYEKNNIIGLKIYDLSNEDVPDLYIIISFIILSTGNIKIFSYIHPLHLSYVYIFICKYIFNIVDTFDPIINKIINATLNISSEESKRALLLICPYTNLKKYKNAHEALTNIVINDTEIAIELFKENELIYNIIYDIAIETKNKQLLMYLIAIKAEPNLEPLVYNIITNKQF